MVQLQTITHRELQSKEPALMSQCWALKSLDMPQLHRSTQPSFSLCLSLLWHSRSPGCFSTGSCFILCTGSALFLMSGLFNILASPYCSICNPRLLLTACYSKPAPRTELFSSSWLSWSAQHCRRQLLYKHWWTNFPNSTGIRGDYIVPNS